MFSMADEESASFVIISSTEPDTVETGDDRVEKVYIPVVGAEIPSTSRRRKPLVGILSDFFKFQIIIVLSFGDIFWNNQR